MELCFIRNAFNQVLDTYTVALLTKIDKIGQKRDTEDTDVI